MTNEYLKERLFVLCQQMFYADRGLLECGFNRFPKGEKVFVITNSCCDFFQYLLSFECDSEGNVSFPLPFHKMNPRFYRSSKSISRYLSVLKARRFIYVTRKGYGRLNSYKFNFKLLDSLSEH